MRVLIYFEVLIKSSLCVLFSLLSLNVFSQKFEVLYVQFDGGIDTTKFLPSPFYPNPDTLAKSIFLYADGKSLIKQTEDTPYERKRYLVEKTTGKFHDLISYNMSKNNVYYNDYYKGETREVSFFLISDTLLKINYRILNGSRSKGKRLFLIIIASMLVRGILWIKISFLKCGTQRIFLR